MAVQGYIKFLKDEERRWSKSEVASRVQEARASEIEQRTARDGKTLIHRDELFAVVDEILGGLKSDLYGLPARVTRDMEQRRQIETIMTFSTEQLIVSSTSV